MKQFFIIIAFLSVVVFQGCESVTADFDRISIISVTPSKALEDGVNYNFTVKIEYDLVTVNSGLLMIGFNTNKINSFSMISDASVIVDKGSGVHTFYINTVAKDWKSEGDFKVYVNISENPHPSTWYPLSTDTMILNFKN